MALNSRSDILPQSRQQSTPTRPSLNYVVDDNGAGSQLVRWDVYGLIGGKTGEAFSVSADSTAAFGMSPVVDGGVTNNHGYKAVFDTTVPGPAAQLQRCPTPKPVRLATLLSHPHSVNGTHKPTTLYFTV